MKSFRRFGWGAAIVALVAVGDARAVIYGLDGGNYNAYQWRTDNLTWDQHRFNAMQATFGGQSGHLVTLTDAAENTYVNNIGSGDRWIGLTDHDLTNGGIASTIDGFSGSGNLGAFETGAFSGGASRTSAGWRWVDGTVYNGAVFQAWNGSEPNNAGQTTTNPGEDAVHYTGSAGLWNDNNAGSSLGDTDTLMDAIYEFNTQIAPAQLQAWKATIVKVQDVQDPGFNVGNLANANSLRNAPVGSTDRQLSFGTQGIATGTFALADFKDSGASGNFAGEPLPPGIAGAADDYVVVYSNQFTVAADGTFTFGFRSDDGGHIRIPGASFGTTTNTNGQVAGSDTLSFAANRGQADTFGQVFLAAGNYNIEFLYWEDGGGSSAGEAFFAPGAFTSFAGNGFKLLGDNTGVLTFANPANNVQTHKARPQINYPDITTLAQADQALAGAFAAPTQVGFPKEAFYDVININNAASGNPTAQAGAFGGIEDPVFGLVNVDDFVFQATALLEVPETGIYTFGVRSDDGARLRIDVAGDGFSDADNIIAGNGVLNFVYADILLTKGFVPIQFTWFERGGGADAEVFAAFNPLDLAVSGDPRNLTNGLVFRLVGDGPNGGLRVFQTQPVNVPEPATGLLGLLGMTLLARRRTRATT